MGIDDLLSRDGLPPSLRLLVLALVATWRGDWKLLAAAAGRGKDRGQPRQDFEETLLQAVLFAGFPRVVTAFETLAETWPAATAPIGGGLPVAEQTAAGHALFGAIYGRNEQAVHAMLRSFHAEFHDFVLEAAYGRILSRPGLSAQHREILASGVLAAQDQLRQFVGHARGAMNFGATKAELHEVLVTVFAPLDDAAAPKPAIEWPEQVAAWMQRLR